MIPSEGFSARIGDEVYDTREAVAVAECNGMTLFIRDLGGAFIVNSLKIDFFGATTDSYAVLAVKPEQAVNWARANGEFGALCAWMRKRHKGDLAMLKMIDAEEELAKVSAAG